MATVLELQNEARAALQKAITVQEERAEGWKEKYDGFFAEYTQKRDEAVQLQQSESEIAKALDDLETADARDATNATRAKTVPAERATGGVKLADGTVVQYADDKTEGWIKGYPASVQLPDITRRLTEEKEAEAQQERDAFSKYIRFGMKGLDGEERKALSRLKDPDRSKALQEDTDSEGGYLVPTDQRSDIILARGTPGGVLRPVSTVFTTSRDGGTFPASNDAFTWATVAEEASFSASDPTFAQVAFTIRKIGRINLVSEELLEDSAVNIPALMTTLATNGRGRYEDQQGIEGDGSTEPLGLRTTGAAQGNVGDITDVFADPPTALEVYKAFFELPAQWRGNARWWTTSSLFSKIVTIGSAAAGIHFTELMVGSPVETLIGRPIFFFDGTGWDDAATIGSGEELGVIGDFSQYYFVDRVGMSVTRLSERYADTDQVGFKFRARYDSFFAENDAFRILKA